MSIPNIELITPNIVNSYRIAEILYRNTNEFVIILHHHSTSYPAIYVKISRPIEPNGLGVCFEAEALHKDFKIMYPVYQTLRDNLIEISGEISKCVCANVATI